MYIGNLLTEILNFTLDLFLPFFLLFSKCLVLGKNQIRPTSHTLANLRVGVKVRDMYTLSFLPLSRTY